MSRIGKAPIPVPGSVEVKIEGRTISVKGPKGELSRQLPGEITVRQDGDVRESRAFHGLTRALVNNMVVGVTDGYRKGLEIIGVGYRAAAKSPTTLELSLGFSHPVVVQAPSGVSFETPQPTRIEIVGIDKEAVGQVAANIRSIRKPEPYKGKGVRYAGERVLRKAGKAAK
jgi:large subunit ribosomal protein L6